MGIEDKNEPSIHRMYAPGSGGTDYIETTTYQDGTSHSIRIIDHGSGTYCEDVDAPSSSRGCGGSYSLSKDKWIREELPGIVIPLLIGVGIFAYGMCLTCKWAFEDRIKQIERKPAQSQQQIVDQVPPKTIERVISE